MENIGIQLALRGHIISLTVSEWRITYLLDLPPYPTDCSNSRTFKPSYFKIWSKHILGKCCLVEYLAWVTNQFDFLHYLCSMIKLKYNCSCSNPKCCLRNQTQPFRHWAKLLEKIIKYKNSIHILRGLEGRLFNKRKECAAWPDCLINSEQQLFQCWEVQEGPKT